MTQIDQRRNPMTQINSTHASPVNNCHVTCPTQLIQFKGEVLLLKTHVFVTAAHFGAVPGNVHRCRHLKAYTQGRARMQRCSWEWAVLRAVTPTCAMDESDIDAGQHNVCGVSPPPHTHEHVCV
jgi:hypothetical protein